MLQVESFISDIEENISEQMYAFAENIICMGGNIEYSLICDAGIKNDIVIGIVVYDPDKATDIN